MVFGRVKIASSSFIKAPCGPIKRLNDGNLQMILKMTMTMMIILILVEVHLDSSVLPALVNPNVGVTVMMNVGLIICQDVHAGMEDKRNSEAIGKDFIIGVCIKRMSTCLMKRKISQALSPHSACFFEACTFRYKQYIQIKGRH